MLPVEKRKPVTGWPSRGITLLYGPPKVGKTTALTTWYDGNILILETEPGGADFIEAYVIDVSSLDQLRSIYRELKDAYANNKAPWKAVAIDTIDVVSDWVEEEVASRYGASQLGEAGVYGADFAAHRSEVLKIIRAFATLPVEVVVVAHSRPLEPGVPTSKTLNLRGQLARIVMAQAHTVIYYDAKERPDGSVDRFFVVAPGSIESGSRIKGLSAARLPPTWRALVEHLEGKKEG